MGIGLPTSLYHIFRRRQRRHPRAPTMRRLALPLSHIRRPGESESDFNWASEAFAHFWQRLHRQFCGQRANCSWQFCHVARIHVSPHPIREIRRSDPWHVAISLLERSLSIVSLVDPAARRTTVSPAERPKRSLHLPRKVDAHGSSHERRHALARPHHRRPEL